MSEVQTSPSPAEAAPAVDVGAVESPAPSGEMTEQSVEVLSSAPEGELLDSPTDETPAPWDHTSWDGNLDNLPDTLQEPVRFLHKQLEGGYTKKFQNLSNERKAFDAARSEWEKKNSSWEDAKASMESELKILRTLMDGGEDPRLKEFRDQYQSTAQELKDLREEHEKFKAFVQKDIDAQARTYAENFKAQHSDIFESPEKREELSGLLDQRWTPEEAVKLMGLDKKVIELASELKEKGVPPEIAVEHAIMKTGATTPRKPRPGAQLTSGAKSQNNPASARRSINNASSSREARLMAAREAVNWRSKNKL